MHAGLAWRCLGCVPRPGGAWGASRGTELPRCLVLPTWSINLDVSVNLVNKRARSGPAYGPAHDAEDCGHEAHVSKIERRLENPKHLGLPKEVVDRVDVDVAACRRSSLGPRQSVARKVQAASTHTIGAYASRHKYRQLPRRSARAKAGSAESHRRREQEGGHFQRTRKLVHCQR